MFKLLNWFLHVLEKLTAINIKDIFDILKDFVAVT